MSEIVTDPKLIEELDRLSAAQQQPSNPNLVTDPKLIEELDRAHQDQTARPKAELDTEFENMPLWKKMLTATSDVGRTLADGMTFGGSDYVEAGVDSLLSGRPYGESKARADKRTEEAGRRTGILRTPTEILGGVVTGTGLQRAGVTLMRPALEGPGIGKELVRTGAAAVEGGIYGAADAAGHDRNVRQGAIAGAAGGALGQTVAERARGILGGEPKFPTRDELEAQAKSAYKGADAQDVIYSKQGVNDLINNFYEVLREKNFHPQNQPRVAQSLGMLDSFQNQNVTYGGMLALKENLNKLANSKDSRQAGIGMQLLGVLDDFMKNAKEGQVLTGDAGLAYDLTKIGDVYNRRYKNLDRLDEALKSVDLRSGSGRQTWEKAAVDALTGMLENPKTANFMNAEEKALAESIIKGDRSTKAMRWLSDNLPPWLVLSNGIGSSTLGVIGSALSGRPAYLLAGVASGAATAGIGAAARSSLNNRAQQGINRLATLYRTGDLAGADLATEAAKNLSIGGRNELATTIRQGTIEERGASPSFRTPFSALFPHDDLGDAISQRRGYAEGGWVAPEGWSLAEVDDRRQLPPEDVQGRPLTPEQIRALDYQKNFRGNWLADQYQYFRDNPLSAEQRAAIDKFAAERIKESKKYGSKKRDKYSGITEMLYPNDQVPGGFADGGIATLRPFDEGTVYDPMGNVAVPAGDHPKETRKREEMNDIEKLGAGVRDALSHPGAFADYLYENAKPQLTFGERLLKGEVTPEEAADTSAGMATGLGIAGLSRRAAGLARGGRLDPSELGIFAGPNSKTANHEMLAKAQQMAKDGASRDDIWKETGWFQGRDGNWRYEIDDSGMSFKPADQESDEWGSSLSDIVNHEKLFEAYPSLRDWTLYEDQPNNSGMTVPEETSLYIGAPEKSSFKNNLRLDTLIHELQHAVQSEENYPGGSSPELVNTETEWILRRLLRSSDPQKRSQAQVLQERLSRIPEENQGNLWFRLYQRQFGETEARNAARRRLLNEKDRRSTAPWESQDLPEEKTIVPHEDLNTAYGNRIPEGFADGGIATLNDIDDPSSPDYPYRHGGSFMTGVIDSAKKAVTLPRRVYEGQVDLNDRDKGVEESLNAAGILSLGGYGRAGLAKPTKDVELGIFAGPASKTANHEMLAKAQQMAKDGATRDQIWKETGWFQGKDGGWRYEIDDSGMKFQDSPYTRRDEEGDPFTAALKNRLEHQELYDAYPNLGHLMLRENQGRSTGYFAHGQGEIAIERPGTKNTYYTTDEGYPYHEQHPFFAEQRRLDVMTHELQHGVQNREGFISGSNPEFVQRQAQEEFQRLWNSDNPAEQAYARKLMEGYRSMTDEQRSNMWFNLYQRNLGEAEARNAARRRLLSKEDRRAIPPWETLDRPEDSLIVPKKDISEYSTQQAPQSITGWHGSPYDFDKFDLNEIGLGKHQGESGLEGVTPEGAMTEGFGHYFTKSKRHAERYRDIVEKKPEVIFRGTKVEQPDFPVTDSTMEQLKHPDLGKTGLTPEQEGAAYYWLRETGSLEGATQWAKRLQRFYQNRQVDPKDRDYNLQLADKYKGIASWLRDNAKEIELVGGQKGKLYQTELDVDPKKDLIDYEKPFIKQPKHVQEALRQVAKDIGRPELLDRDLKDPLSTHDIHRALGGPKREISDILREYGVPGSTSVEHNADSTLQGARYYTIWDDPRIKILNKYAKGGLASLKHRCMK